MGVKEVQWGASSLTKADPGRPCKYVWDTGYWVGDSDTVAMNLAFVSCPMSLFK